MVKYNLRVIKKSEVSSAVWALGETVKNGGSMPEFHLLLVLIGLIFLIYSKKSKEKLGIYNRSRDVKILESDEFFKLQWKFSVMNSAYLVLTGIVLYSFNLPPYYFLLSVLGFHFINYLAIYFAAWKGYIQKQ